MPPPTERLRAAPFLAGVACVLLQGATAHAALRDVESLPGLAQFGVIIEASPPERRVHLQRLQPLLAQGDDAEALRYLRSLADRQPSLAADLHEALAGVYLRERRLFRATRHLESIPDPQRSDQARYLEANIAARQQRLAAALALLERLARRRPEDVLVARDEAQVASLLARHGQAAAACERLLRLQPRDKHPFFGVPHNILATFS